MKHRIRISFVALMALFVTVAAGLARSPAPPPVNAIRWAGNVNLPESGRLNIVHAPDNRITPVDPPLTLSEFSPAMRYPHLSGLLSGVRAADLSRSDVIAFEGNGGVGAGSDGGWESSIWTFSDGINRIAVTFNACLGAAGSDPRVVATGSITGDDGTIHSGNAAYSAFFGLCSPDPTHFVVSYILFDLHSVSPAIDIDSPNFAITIENYHTGLPNDPSCGPGLSGEGTPDPDAVGVLSRCSGR